jgi:hypothetical protein
VLPARKGSYDHDLIGGAQRCSEAADLLAVDEDLDVAPYLVLLADDAETDAGIAPVEVVEELADGTAGSVDGGRFLRVAGERGGYVDLHEPVSRTMNFKIGIDRINRIYMINKIIESKF